MVGEEHFVGGHQAPAVERDETLVDHALQCGGQLHLDLIAPVRGEHVDDAVDGLGAVVGVQGGEDQVPGLGDGQRRGDALEVAHLAHEQDVGVFRRAERRALGNDSVSLPTSRWLTAER